MSYTRLSESQYQREKQIKIIDQKFDIGKTGIDKKILNKSGKLTSVRSMECLILLRTFWRIMSAGMGRATLKALFLKLIRRKKWDLDGLV